MLSLHRLAGDIFERGRSFFKFKIKICMVFVFKKKSLGRVQNDVEGVAQNRVVFYAG